jgi:hypothetical protein
MLTKSRVGRAAVVTGSAIAIAAFVAMALASWTPPKVEKDLLLVYVGAKNCAPCDIWQRNQGAVFRDSTEFRHLTYREVNSSSLFDVLEDTNWPEDLRAYRQAIDRGAGVPLWLVIADHQLVMQSSGLTKWQETVLPKIKSLLR